MNWQNVSMNKRKIDKIRQNNLDISLNWNCFHIRSVRSNDFRSSLESDTWDWEVTKQRLQVFTIWVSEVWLQVFTLHNLSQRYDKPITIGFHYSLQSDKTIWVSEVWQTNVYRFSLLTTWVSEVWQTNDYRFSLFTIWVRGVTNQWLQVFTIHFRVIKQFESQRCDKPMTTGFHSSQFESEVWQTNDYRFSLFTIWVRGVTNQWLQVFTLHNLSQRCDKPKPTGLLTWWRFPLCLPWLPAWRDSWENPAAPACPHQATWQRSLANLLLNSSPCNHLQTRYT